MVLGTHPAKPYLRRSWFAPFVLNSLLYALSAHAAPPHHDSSAASATIACRTYPDLKPPTLFWDARARRADARAGSSARGGRPPEGGGLDGAETREPSEDSSGGRGALVTRSPRPRHGRA